MESDAELRAKIERVRRSTRNTDVLDICDAALAMLSKPTVSNTDVVKRREQAKLRMRRWRAKGKKDSGHGLS